MPQAGINWFKEQDVLNFVEILRLVAILTDLGIEKVRFDDDLRNMLRRGHSDNEIKMRLLSNVKKKPEGIVRIITESKLKPSLSLMHKIGG
jgi:molybdenum cofactor biosynthesis enzyme MoaA